MTADRNDVRFWDGALQRFTGFDDKIIALYARGMTVREIKAHLQPGGTELTEPAKHGQPTGTTLTATRSR